MGGNEFLNMEEMSTNDPMAAMGGGGGGSGVQRMRRSHAMQMQK